MNINNFQEFLKNTNIIDFHNTLVFEKAKELAQNKTTDIEIAKSCFEYVRDVIQHTGDNKDTITTISASDVLRNKTGWCYSKSHLLAGLLRANNIPAGICYQRLKCSEYKEGAYCLHALNTCYLTNYGWYKVDARGNKNGVDAQFNPPTEKLAFELQMNEYELPNIYSKPLDVVVNALYENDTYTKMIENFPDVEILSEP